MSLKERVISIIKRQDQESRTLSSSLRHVQNICQNRRYDPLANIVPENSWIDHAEPTITFSVHTNTSNLSQNLLQELELQTGKDETLDIGFSWLNATRPLFDETGTKFPQEALVYIHTRGINSKSVIVGYREGRPIIMREIPAGDLKALKINRPSKKDIDKMFCETTSLLVNFAEKALGQQMAA